MLKLDKKKFKLVVKKARKAKRMVLAMKRKVVNRVLLFLKQVRAWRFEDAWQLARPRVSKFMAVVLAIGLALQSWGSAALQTSAMYNDIETSSANVFTAGALDFSLDADSWQPTETVNDGLLPGDMVTRQVKVVNDGLLDFQYTVEAVKTSGDNDFCNALDLVAKRDSVPLYSGSLLGLNISPPVVYATTTEDTWLFEVTLPSGNPTFEGKNCEFKFVFKGWQTDLPAFGGFSDIEELENILEGGSESQDFYLSDWSPIKDAFVHQHAPNNNDGDDTELKIRSKDGDENRRTFIKFDFHLPQTTLVSLAKLKLYMKDAPSEIRSYEVRKSLADWNEVGPGGITWNNQPGVSGSVTDAVFSGTTNGVWVMWDVLPDVQGFVASATPNFGWRIGDTNENSTSTKEGRFVSRDSETDEHRPVLEVAFSAPPATTTHLVINEVYYHVASGNGSDANNEWVEIYNPTNSAVDISGWQICDNSSCDTIPNGTPPIPAKGFALITDKASTWGYWPGIPAGTVLVALNSNIGGGLANSGDRVILKDGADSIVDEISYGDDTSVFDPAVPESGRNKTLARIIKGYDYDTAFDWVINAAPNPGTNPSQGGEEVMRFTSEGVEVAKTFDDLAPLVEDPQPQEVTTTAEQPAPPNCGCSQTVEDKQATSTPDTLVEQTATTTPDYLQGGGAVITPDISQEAISQVPKETASTTPDTEQPPAPETAPTEEPAPPATETPAAEQPATEAPAPVVGLEEIPAVQEAPAPEIAPVQEAPPQNAPQAEAPPAIIEPQVTLTSAPAEAPSTGGGNE